MSVSIDQIFVSGKRWLLSWLAGTPDWVELTMGTTFELFRRSTLAVGIVTPVTGPKPYDLEVLAQLNLRF